MFLEEFRALPVLGSSMAASSGLFTCYMVIPSGTLETGPINIKLIINPERREEVKEPEPKAEEPQPTEEIIQPEPPALPPEPIVPQPPAPPKPKVEKRAKRRKPPKRKTIRNYKSKSRDHRDVFLVKPNSGQSYWLYRPHGPLDFSFKFRDPNVDFSEIDEGSMRIRLFRRSAWEDMSLWEDEYGDPLTQDQIKELFGDLDPKRTKQLLFSLSVKRTWRKHVDDHYTSDRPNTLHTKPWHMNIGIKYFKTFPELKEYVQAKVDNCRDDVPCTADESELGILHQDQISFFSN